MLKPLFTRSVFAAIASLTTCIDIAGSDCKNNILSNLTTPDARYKAYLFERECGATVSTSIHVSFVPTTDTLSNASRGNVLVCDYACNVSMQWKNPRTLLLKHHAFDQQPLLRAPTFRDISIQYVEIKDK